MSYGPYLKTAAVTSCIRRWHD